IEISLSSHILLSPPTHTECLSVSPLQHTHIMPLRFTPPTHTHTHTHTETKRGHAHTERERTQTHRLFIPEKGHTLETHTHRGLTVRSVRESHNPNRTSV